MRLGTAELSSQLLNAANNDRTFTCFSGAASGPALGSGGGPEPAGEGLEEGEGACSSGRELLDAPAAAGSFSWSAAKRDDQAARIDVLMETVKINWMSD